MNFSYMICEKLYFHLFYTIISISHRFWRFILLPSESQFLISPVYVRTHGSELPWRTHILPSSLFFINPKVCLERDVCLLLCVRNVYKWGRWSDTERETLRPGVGTGGRDIRTEWTGESAHLADSADVVGSFLFLSLLSYAEQQGGVLFIALHSQRHEALRRLQQLEATTHIYTIYIYIICTHIHIYIYYNIYSGVQKSDHKSGNNQKVWGLRNI